MARAEDLLASGWQALADAQWEDARQAFEKLLASERSAAAVEGLSWAAFWRGDAEAVFRARQEAYTLYRREGDRISAARMAIWLGSDHIDFRGEDAIAQGWYARAARLLDGLRTAPEHGWLAFQTGAYALELHDDTETAKRQAAEVAHTGRTLGSVDLEMLGLALEGLALVTEGDLTRGMRCLDEAAVSATGDEAAISETGDEVSSRVASSWTLCYLLDACERARDFDRAAQWCRRMETLYARLAYHFGLGVCRAHYASVLVLRGEWESAEAALVLAATDFERAHTLPAIAESDARLGELRRRQGRPAEAAELFERARPHPIAVVGSAALALDQGDPVQAVDVLERFLAAVPTASLTQRADAVEILVRARLALGAVAAAADAAVALDGIARTVGTRPLRAAAAAADARVAAERGDHAAACWRLEAAIDDYLRSGLPFEAAWARLDLAASLDALGRADAAARQSESGTARLRELGVVAGALPSPQDPSPLSPREAEVLRLVCDGLADRQIGERLHISPHTVHRHVSNIFTKLGVSSRAAAAAQAAKLGLV